MTWLTNLICYILAPAAVIAALAWLAAKKATERADREAAAKRARAERQARVNEFARDTRAAFLAQMVADRPHLASILARQEAEGFDPEAVDWTQRSGR